MLTERILLPTLGKPYINETWYNGDSLSIRPLKVKEYKEILNSPNDYTTDLILKNCIIEDVDVYMLAVPDVEVLLLRIACCSGLYGNEIGIPCGNGCKGTVSMNADLDSVDIKYLERQVSYPFELELPDSGFVLKMELPRYGRTFDMKRRFFNGDDGPVFEKMMTVDSIGEIDGVVFKTLGERREAFECLSAIDASYVIDVYSSIGIGPDSGINGKCPVCGKTSTITYPIDIRLFCNTGNDDGGKVNFSIYESILSKQMDLCEHAHMTFSDTDNLYLFELDTIYKMAIKRSEEKAEAMKEEMNARKRVKS